MQNYIKSINWILTYKCNLKCSHCDIWNNPYKNEASISDIKKILNTDIIKKSYEKYWDMFDIAISWWEPLLITNLKEIITQIDNIVPNTIHCISTNWVLIDKLIDLIIYWEKKWKSFKKINISIDWNQANHDKQRWMKWIFLKTIKNIVKLKKIFPNQIIEIKLTITKNNYNDILYISKLADKIWVFFSFKPVENMNNYTNQNSQNITCFSNNEITAIENQIINNPYITKQNYYISPIFFNSIPEYLRNWLWERKKKCSIAKNTLTIMPDLKVYSCILMNSTWNLYNDTLDEIWNSKKIKKQIWEIENWECPECMLMCWAFKSKETYE